MRPFIAIVVAGLLTACATEPVNRQATVQNAVYLAGDGAVEARTAAYPDAAGMAKPDMAPNPPLRKLYWYFSGR